MKTLLFALLLTLASTQMSFNLANAGYQRGSNSWKLVVPCNGGNPPYSYNYQNLPSNWASDNSSVIIPIFSVNAGGNFPIQCIVTDSQGNQLKRTLLVKVSTGGILLGDYNYDETFGFTSTAINPYYYSSFTNSNPASSSSSSLSTSSSPSSSNSGSSILNNIVNSAAITSSPVASSTSGVIPVVTLNNTSTLPNDNDLDKIINSGDVVSISKIVQLVIASNLSCDRKIGYLNNFIGRIGSYIQIKQARSNQIQNIINNANNAIASLNAEIYNYTSAINQLGIPALEIQQNQALADLQTAYNIYNQSQLAAAQQKATALQSQITSEQNFIITSNQTISSLNQDNINLNNQITAINKKTDTLINAYHSQETNADNIKNQIAAAQTSQAQYITEIAQAKTQIQQDQVNLDPTELNANNIIVRNLNNTLPSLQQQIDFVKFNCAGATNYTVVTQNGATVYTFTPGSFVTYFTNYYALPTPSFATSIVGPQSSISLASVNIFSPLWVSTYGPSFSTDINAIQTNSSQSGYSFPSDFSCSSSNIPVTDSGIIISIKSNVIVVKVKSTGSNINVIAGSCTSINSIPKNNVISSNLTLGYIPQAGNSITYRGYSQSSNVQAVSLTCY